MTVIRHTSHIELSRSALKNNVRFIRGLLGETLFSSVVKGHAYGHGIEFICPMLYELGQRHFSVFSADEAFNVSKCIPNDVTIMIMGYCEDEQIEWAVENEIEFFVFEQRRLEKALETARRLDKPARVHIEVETGMNRTGFSIKDLERLFKDLKEHRAYLDIRGVCSHLAGAESIANYKRIKDQYERFRRVRRQIESTDWVNPQFHLACSAATIQYPKTRMDIARIGIMQYGYFPSTEVLVQYMTKQRTHENPLQRVITWKTRVMDVKTVKAGEFIGYGTSFFTNVKTTVAFIPVGYSHGFSRSLSNQGKVLIRGQRFDVIGLVNMNMLAVDITENNSIEKGEEVVLIGRQGELEISVASFGDYSNLVNYELLTRLPLDIERIITN